MMGRIERSSKVMFIKAKEVNAGYTSVQRSDELKQLGKFTSMNRQGESIMKATSRQWKESERKNVPVFLGLGIR